MALRIKSIDLEQMKKYRYVTTTVVQGEETLDYIGGIVLEDGEATMRFKPTKEQCDHLWMLIEGALISWAKALINGEVS